MRHISSQQLIQSRQRVVRGMVARNFQALIDKVTLWKKR